ncbi:MAG: YutD-like domain-containing protein [Bacilli bacterium]
MKKIVFNNIEYKIEKNYKDGYDETIVRDLLTEYFNDFDYVFGDFSYDKLRLKGFYDSHNKKKTSINDIKNLDDYIKNYCSYECRYFLLKKVR